ncbi:uncharacterized protein LOC117639428 isoform X2 [Thrips palmi]|uniref:Uncharacterized protein LOC117639428 isoform X2 n=1 Tax=Thrips palmi TaxID=161013 RepID=A0A6P8XVH3_THRPL|nr:uncharacterized protein LOC117639428 isoform X2 [Thrips palmi]
MARAASRLALPSALPPLAFATLLVAVVNVTAGLQGRVRDKNKTNEVHAFGAKEPGDVELFTKLVRRKHLPTKGRLDAVRYPPGGGESKNVVTHVEVSVPQRTLTKDEVHITEGGPGMRFVALTVGGRRSFLVDYTVTVFGHEAGVAKPEKHASGGGSTEPAAATGGPTEDAAAAEGSPDKPDDSP